MIKLINEDFFEREDSVDKKSGKLLTKFNVPSKLLPPDKKIVVASVIYDEELNMCPTKIKVTPDQKNPKKTLVKISQKENLQYDTDVYIVAIPSWKDSQVLPVPFIKGLRFYKYMCVDLEKKVEGIIENYSPARWFDQVIYFIMVPDNRFLTDDNIFSFNFIIRESNNEEMTDIIHDFEVFASEKKGELTDLSIYASIISGGGDNKTLNNSLDYDYRKHMCPLPLFRLNKNKYNSNSSSKKEHKEYVEKAVSNSNTHNVVNCGNNKPKSKTATDYKKTQSFNKNEDGAKSYKRSNNGAITSQEELDRMIDNAFKDDPTKDRYISTGRSKKHKRR